MDIKITINSCYECPYVTNSAREHNDPFTSEPHPTYWWCDSPKQNYYLIIDDPKKIHAQCPENKIK